MHPPRLLFSRRFGPIFTAMALGAFNDNYYKNAFTILVTFRLAEKIGMSVGALISIATACFIVPFFLFSGTAGIVADKFPKYKLARILKLTELLLVFCAVTALFMQHISGMMIILFLLGAQAAFFGPVKYAILAELLHGDELLTGNGYVEAGTFIAILLGTTLGGLLILNPYGIEIVAASMLAVSVIGVIAAWNVPHTTAAHAELHLPRNPLYGLWGMIVTILRARAMLLPILGISWFWAIGATYLTQIPVFTKQVIGADQEVSTAFFALFSIGVAVGSVLCPMVSRRLPPRWLAPLSLLGICAFGLDLCWVGYHSIAAAPLLNLVEYLGLLAHWRIAADLFLMAACGGLFTIPLYTKLQLAAGCLQRARAIASNNVMNALFIAAGSLAAAACYALQLQVMDVLLIFGLANIPVIALLALAGVRQPTP